MAPKIAVPTSSDGLVEVLLDKNRSKELSNREDFSEFMRAYTAQFSQKNPDTEDELRTQVQSILFESLRNSGSGRVPGVSLANGSPRLSFASDSDAALSRGRGAVYNKASAGAAMEKAIPADDQFRAIGEYCAAIRYKHSALQGRNRADLIRKLDAVEAFQNSFSEEDPGAGGFLVPELMRSELLQLALEESLVRQRATMIPMSTLRVPIPMVDDTSHVTSLFGGVQFYWESEGAPLVESQATFGKVALEARKLTGYFKVPNELLADAPAFGGFFNTKIPQGLSWKEDVDFLTGDGSDKPLGVINSPAYIKIDRAATNAIAYTDIVTMFSRLLPQSQKNAVWILSIDAFPQIAEMSLATPGIWMGGYNVPGIAEAPPVTIFGRPVYFTEKVPATSASGGLSGDISLLDLSFYLIGDRQTVAVAASEHVAFQNDQTAYRIIERVDGRPWVQSAITPHNGGPTLSPYVGLSATHT